MVINKYNKVLKHKNNTPFIELSSIQTLKTYPMEVVFPEIIGSIQSAGLRESSTAYYSTSVAAGVEIIYGMLITAPLLDKVVVRNYCLNELKSREFDNKKINNAVIMFILHWILRLECMQEVMSEEMISGYVAEMELEEVANETRRDIADIVSETVSLFDPTAPRQLTILEAFIIFIRSIRFIDETSSDFIAFGNACWSAFKKSCEQLIAADSKLMTLRWKLIDYETETFEQLPGYRSIVKM
jgi:hypothetical protein